MAYSLTIPEAQLINEVARDWFGAYDCTKMIGDIDFCVSDKAAALSPQLWAAPDYIWAEAKAGNRHDVYESFVQLLLTIGKARTFEKHLPPSFLGAFDAEKIAFLPYHSIMAVFSQNDFNWKVTPSDHDSKEFRQLYDQVRDTIEAESLLFSFGDGGRLREFIKASLKPGPPILNRIEITRNNFVSVYFRWAETVKPSITVNWDGVKKQGIIDADFYLADLLSEDNKTIKQKLYVLLQSTYYQFAKRPNADLGYDDYSSAGFNDGQKAHQGFWKQYKRPPKEEFWDYIIEHRDLLVPQDVRERKGSYFTPRQWVELSQKYLADVLGENWQDEYYIWDCAAGTGNLLAGLTDKYKIWASTIDQADVDVMLDRIEHGANLLESHVFKFDFLNDSFDKLPAGLKAIVDDPEKRKKLVVYINPPYAEATNSKTRHSEKSRNKPGVSKNNNYTYNKFKGFLGRGINEVFIQFLARIYDEISGCIVANFSTTKIIQSVNYQDFRKFFRAALEKIFIVPASTFDNVEGQFPIGFHIWNPQKIRKQENFMVADSYDANGAFLGRKKIFYSCNGKTITDWLIRFRNDNTLSIGYLNRGPVDFQNNTMICIVLKPTQRIKERLKAHTITRSNLIENAVFITVRRIIPETWLNNHDQFLWPLPSWESDDIFQDDCLAWSLFSAHNRISCAHGVNHWIPFTEVEVGAKEAFDSHFMTDYMAGKLGDKKGGGDYKLGETYSSAPSAPLEFSPAAKAVFDAGRELWRYYHAQPGANPNAALYDIKAHFQGRDAKGRMNAKSGDDTYNGLMANLRAALKALAAQIEPKVYEHGFLKA